MFFLLYVLLYSYSAAIFAALFYFGIYTAKWMCVFNLLIFGLTIVFMGWMLHAGSKANKLKREHDFWLE